MVRWLCVLMAMGWTAAAADIRGAAQVEKPARKILTWGRQLVEWDTAGKRPRVLLDGRDFGPGGCVADVDGDGRDDLLVQEHPGVSRWLWLRAPRWESKVIEEETDFRDCLAFEIAGQRGVLVPHLNAQLRFYEFPGFAYKELYSIYTASQQGGLLASDVDGDGLQDLFLGNYWVRNPGVLDVAWRLFAINVFHETPTAALARQALLKRPGKTQPDLVWAESEAEEARLVWYERPADVKQLWVEHRLTPELRRPKALLVRPEGIFVGHADGVALFQWQESQWRMTTVASGFETVALFEERGRVLAVGTDRPRAVYPRR